MREIRNIRKTAERLKDDETDVDLDVAVLAEKLHKIADFAAEMMSERDEAYRRKEEMEAELDIAYEEGRQDLLDEIVETFESDEEVS